MLDSARRHSRSSLILTSIAYEISSIATKLDKSHEVISIGLLRILHNVSVSVERVLLT